MPPRVHEICTLPECDVTHWARGWCLRHYTRWRKYGDPRAFKRQTPTIETFWSQVAKTDGCWFWTGRVNRDGYGVTGFEMRAWMAHRLAYELDVGPIPKGLQVHHTCKNRRCVRPEHFQLLTPSEHARIEKLERPLSATCGKGHPWTPENTYTWNGSPRKCRACRVERMQLYRSKDF